MRWNPSLAGRAAPGKGPGAHALWGTPYQLSAVGVGPSPGSALLQSLFDGPLRLSAAMCCTVGRRSSTGVHKPRLSKSQMLVARASRLSARMFSKMVTTGSLMPETQKSELQIKISKF